MRIPLLVLAGSLAAAAASGATFVVDSVGDEPDDNTADNVCHTAVNTCTLRAAIQQSNATAGPDVIHFAISGSGVQVIQPASALPSLTDPVTIDGYSQPGASPNTQANRSNAVLLIEIDGSASGAGASGLTISTTGCTIKGLEIVRFSASGIWIDATAGGAAGGHTIQGNWIGMLPDGNTRAGNGAFGIFIRSPNNLVGGPNPGERNAIEGAGGDPLAAQIKFQGDLGASIQGNVVQGNYIGTDVLGFTTYPPPNAASGIVVQSGTAGEGGVIIGGTAAGSGNIIGGLQFYGVEIQSSPCTVTTSNVVVAGNGIGMNLEPFRVDNGYGGVHLGCGATNNTIGGTSAGAGNVIAFNGSGSFTGGGVLVDGTQTVPMRNAILGNLIYSNTRKLGGPVAAGLDIDLGSDGQTPNDPGDGDTGPNGLQNYPVVIDVSVVNGVATVRGNLDSTPNQSYRIELFTYPYPFQTGRHFLTFVDVSTNASGIASFAQAFPIGKINSGDEISATATDPFGNTSELSPSVSAAPALAFYAIPPCRVVDTRNPNGPYGGPSLTANQVRFFVVAGQCGIPSNAKAIAFNVAVTQSSAAGFLSFGDPVSAINYAAGQTRANNGIVALESNGSVGVFTYQPFFTSVDLILDIYGYFQ
jgi:CSLREA domain-containing protein